MTRRYLLAPCLSLLLCACGHASTSHPQSSPQVAQQARPAAPQQQAARAQQPAAAAQSANEQAAAAQESGDTGDDDKGPPDRGDVSLEHLAALPATAVLPSGKWKAGVNYEVLSPAQPTSVAPGKVEVLEVFWFGCPHCFALEPFIEKWLQQKPSYIEFVRVPVMWGPVHRAHARLFYTLKALNHLDLFEKAFTSVQNDPNHLIGQDDASTLKVQEAWAQANGLKLDDFDKAYASFAVNSDLERAEELTQRYQVQGVPEIVINGKFTADVQKAGGHEQLMQMTGDLAASEHHH